MILHRVCHNRTVKCDICGAMVSSKRTLQAHMVWDHGEEKKFSCDFCPAKFMSFKNKKKHLVSTFILSLDRLTRSA